MGELGIIAVMGRSEAVERLAAFDPTHVLSLLQPDPGYEPPELPAHIHHKMIWVHDIDRNPGGRWIAPSRDHAREIMIFGREATEGRLLIHCAAGLSRSAAAALSIATQRIGLIPAIAWLRQHRPLAGPNTLLARLCGEEIGLGKELEDAAYDMRG